MCWDTHMMNTHLIKHCKLTCALVYASYECVMSRIQASPDVTYMNHSSLHSWPSHVTHMNRRVTKHDFSAQMRHQIHKLCVQLSHCLQADIDLRVFAYVDMYKYMCIKKSTTFWNKGTKSKKKNSPIDCCRAAPLRIPLTGLPISKTMILCTLQINKSTLSIQTHKAFKDRVALGLWQRYWARCVCWRSIPIGEQDARTHTQTHTNTHTHTHPHKRIYMHTHTLTVACVTALDVSPPITNRHTHVNSHTYTLAPT